MQRIQTFTLLAGTTAAIIVVIFILVKWNNNLNREVRRRTSELDESNQQLMQANKQLKVHEKMQREFINIAAHELRTPVQPILGLSAVLLSRMKEGSEERILLNIISRNAKRLAGLAENILDATRIESQLLKLKKERLNLNDVILDCINDMTANKDYSDYSSKNDVEVLHQIQKDTFVVEADKARISQVISNLLGNAIKFSPQHGGRISIKSEKEEIDGRNKSQVIVSIKDNGTGIGPDIFPRLFSRFTSKSSSGTGLGLFISKKIIEAHGGRIWARNNQGEKGATFSFSLPLNDEDDQS
jgi:signal transduction histidine kinase